MSIAKKLLLLFVGLGLLLVVIEFLLLARGFEPWQARSFSNAKERFAHNTDPELGWKTKPGVYRIPASKSLDHIYEVTILEDGRRSTGNRNAGAQTKVLLVGDALLHGWAITDKETVGWKLQEGFPGIEFLNFAVSGYSTYQSLLLLEKQLPFFPEKKLILYGFIEEHQERNIASAAWLRDVSSYRVTQVAALPYATYEDGKGLQRHSPISYTTLPGHEYSALLTWLEDTFMKWRTRGREAQKRLVTEQLLLKMERLSNLNGARFVPVFLTRADSEPEHFPEFLRANDIPYIDCRREISPETLIAGEGLPNAELNRHWAECIAAKLPSFTAAL